MRRTIVVVTLASLCSCGPCEEVTAVTIASDGAHATVETALVDPVAVGDTLLVHAGTALTAVRA